MQAIPTLPAPSLAVFALLSCCAMSACVASDDDDDSFASDDDSTASDDDTGNDDDSAVGDDDTAAGDDDSSGTGDDDDSGVPPVLGCAVTDPSPGPVDGTSYQDCVDQWPQPPWACPDVAPLLYTVHGTGYGDDIPACGVGCESENWAMRVADQTAFDAAWEMVSYGPPPSLSPAVFEQEQVFVLFNFCSGGGWWLEPQCVGLAPDGSLLVETFWHNYGGSTTGAETAHVTAFSVPCNQWPGGAIAVRFGGEG